jgi:hypothetical protein
MLIRENRTRESVFSERSPQENTQPDEANKSELLLRILAVYFVARLRVAFLDLGGN